MPVMTSTRTRLVAGLAAFAAAAALAACSTATKEEHAGPATSAAAQQGGAHNEDDLQFAQMMIPHHQQAVELSALVPDRSTDPALIKLAAAISAAQQPEIDTMKGLLKGWGVNPDEMSHESGHAGLAVSGMVNDETMLKLETLKGADFDKLWLQSMVGHHEGAIAMAKVEASAGKNAELMTMARNIITSQQAEIDQMKQMLAAVGN